MIKRKNLTLSRLPMPAKLLFTAALLTLGTGYIFALTNVALKVGFTPEEATLKYYGNEASRQALEEMTDNTVSADEEGVSDEESFSFDEFEEDQGDAIVLVPVPTLEALIAEAHFHLFGYVSIFFICGLIIMFADVRPVIKSMLILAPFIASVFDIWSILLTRFVSPVFSYVLIGSGMIMAASFLAVFVISIYQMWFLRDPEKTAA